MSPSNFYAGLFLITACTLMLQVIQTRILSVVAWYHLAFFAISMAMFGLTAGAVWVYFRRDRLTERTLSYDLAYFSAALAVTILACLIVQMSLAPMVTRSITSLFTWVELAICMSIPFFLSGIVVSLALTRSPFPIGRVYGADLLGAAMGCLGVLLLLDNASGPSAILWVGAIAAAGALFFSRSAIGIAPDEKMPLDAFLRRRTAICLFLVACAGLNDLTRYGLQPLVIKGKFEAGNSHIFREWNTFSRVSVGPSVTRRPFMWGPSPEMPRDGIIVDQRNIEIDGDAGSSAFHFTGDTKKVDFLKYDVTALAYHLPHCERAAVIGVGGGRDILTAAIFGCREITGVEINPILVDLLTRKPGFTDFTNLATLRGVRFVVDEGRSWMARTEQTFDVIQMSLIDTWAATGAGAFSLSENSLYTTEAWSIFLKHLTPRGVFTVSRWYDAEDPTETGRMLSLGAAALMNIGVTEPRRHLFLAVQRSIATLVVAREPFGEADLRSLSGASDQYGHGILVSPTVTPPPGSLRDVVTASSREDLDRCTSGLAFDLSPATDDRPFFFNQLPLSKPIRALYVAKEMLSPGAELGGIRKGNLVATATLLILSLVSLVLVLATIIVPLRPALRDVGGRLVAGGTAYFVLIGVGFMMVEIALLQRMSIFLGHPVYSLSVLLFSLISSTGVGSLLSDKFPLDSRMKFVGWALLTATYIATLPAWLPRIFVALEGSSLLARAVLCVATIAPGGVLLGFGFPTGMRLIEAIDRKPTPWFWGVNGAAGTLASAVAVMTSIAFGISTTLIMGALCYSLLIPVVLFLVPLRFEAR